MVRDLTKRFGLLISSLTFLLFLINIFISYHNYGSIIFNDMQFVLLFISTIMFISSFYPIGKYLQVIILCLTSMITILFTSEFGLGLVQLVVIILLSDKYNFFKRKLILKVSVFISIYLTCIIMSQKLSGITFLDNIQIYVYFFLISSIIILIKFEEIKIAIEKEKGYKEEIRILHESLTLSKKHYDMLDKSYIDPLEAGLTKAEFELLKNLCLYRETNADLAQRLTKSINTVKVQMKKVLIKIGADTRHQLIDLCQNYFIEKEHLSSNPYND